MATVQEQILAALARNEALKDAQLARDAEPAPAGFRDLSGEWVEQARRVLREGR